MRGRALAALLLAGCTGSALPGGGDGGTGGDGPAAADLRGASCGDVQATVRAWIEGHTACQVDADCTETMTACGLHGECGVYVNTDAPGPYLDSLVADFKARCGAVCGPCPLAPAQPPGCVAGRCGAKAPGAGAVGDACASDTACATGQCVTQAESKLFAGGYCTIADCDRGIACPAGSTCKPGGDGRSYCLKDCDPRLSKPQCRNGEGYACCTGPGPQGSQGWCAPQQSGLCLSG